MNAARNRLAAALIVLLVPGMAFGQSGNDIFAGKALQIIVGLGAGGGYDLWARSLARHIGKHLPGRPAVIVQNMPGAGAIIAAIISTPSHRKTAPSSASLAVTRRSRRCAARRPRVLTPPNSPGSARPRQRPMSASPIGLQP